MPAPTVNALVPTLFLTDADVAALADWPAAVAALAQAYAQAVPAQSVPPRSMARADGLWLRGLTAISPRHGAGSGHLGCKLIAASPRARCASYLISLFDPETMALTALIDGNRVTGLRTAATAAVAARHLAPAGPLDLAVLGSGFEAQGALDCLLADARRQGRAVGRVRVYSPTPARREALAAHAAAQGVAARACASGQDAVAGATLVLCATRSRDETPVLQGDWLAPGATVLSLGSTLPEQREVDVSTLARATTVVADMPEEVLHDTGDALAAVAAGVPLASRLLPLHAVVSGQAPARHHPHDITVYKSVGSALQDVVMAEMLLARARQAGRGTPLPVGIVPVAK
ncbi:ornithine cyclodeaminase family protein [Ideonella livida]|uniref:Ornithine cyclodeaminase family protein n=1 Tax=Ideonella livida TaxID=2707176 RepID=A0A7C9PJX5_9BURK|nr:ornithine cyclodeaminase family protein [Ideonella livida]NDY93895.1 ornithine cyclodeaminase family protein [Ideonella livida]